MLPQVVLAIESACVHTLFFALPMVMKVQMIIGGIVYIAVYAFTVS